LPELFLTKELTVTELVYVVVLPITGCAVLLIINPAGPTHLVETFAAAPSSSSGFNSTVHIRVIADPID
jgi:hypothetical protein